MWTALVVGGMVGFTPAPTMHHKMHAGLPARSPGPIAPSLVSLGLERAAFDPVLAIAPASCATASRLLPPAFGAAFVAVFIPLLVLMLIGSESIARPVRVLARLEERILRFRKRLELQLFGWPLEASPQSATAHRTSCASPHSTNPYPAVEVRRQIFLEQQSRQAGSLSLKFRTMPSV